MPAVRRDARPVSPCVKCEPGSCTSWKLAASKSMGCCGCRSKRNIGSHSSRHLRFQQPFVSERAASGMAHAASPAAPRWPDPARRSVSGRRSPHPRSSHDPHAHLQNAMRARRHRIRPRDPTPRAPPGPPTAKAHRAQRIAQQQVLFEAPAATALRAAACRSTSSGSRLTRTASAGHRGSRRESTAHAAAPRAQRFATSPYDGPSIARCVEVADRFMLRPRLRPRGATRPSRSWRGCAAGPRRCRAGSPRGRPAAAAAMV